MLINGLDAKTTYGFTLDSAPSWLDTPNTDTPSAKVLRRGGATVLDNPRDQVRSVTLRGTVTGSTVQDARDKVDALKLALRKNTGVQVTFDDLPLRYIKARVQSVRVPPFGPSMLQRKVSIEALLTLHDPYSYDLDDSSNMFWYEPGDTIAGESYARAGLANYFDSNGILQSAPVSVKRDAHYINGVRTFLTELGVTNIVVSPRDLTNAAWVKTNCTVVKDVTGIDGAANSASRMTATAGNATCLQAITLASSLRNQSVYVKRGIGSGVVQMTMDNGATWTAIAVTANWTRVQIPNQTLANPTVGFRIVTSGDQVAFDYVQNENAADPSSPIIGSRSADNGVLPWTAIPQAMTFYCKLIEQTTDTANQRRIARIGNSDVTPMVLLYHTGSSWSFYHHNGVAAVQSATADTVVVGDTVELRGVLLPSGAVYVGFSRNGGAETVGATSAANALAAAWGAQTLSFPYPGFENHGIVAFRVVRGVRSMAQMRAATKPSTSLNSATTVLPLGTGPVRPIISINGAATNPVITLYNVNGVAVATMSLTVAMVAGDSLVIDSDAKTITLNGVNRLDLLTSGDFFTIDPADSGFDGAGPTIASSSGALSVSYKRSWR